MARVVTRTVLGCVAVLVILGSAACRRAELLEISFTVEGMHCDGCSAAITSALEAMDGVVRASADHVTGTADATFTSPPADPDRMSAEIESLGYTVTKIDVQEPAR